MRDQIINFIKEKLNVGGVCLISYNSQVKWSAMTPIRALMHAHANSITPLIKQSSDRAKESLDFVEALMALPCAEPLKGPHINSMLATLKGTDASYLAHEFLNEHHVPFNFLEVSQALSKAKLEFATSAYFSSHLANIQLLPEEQKFLSQVADNVTIYEMVKDLMFSTSFRSDYWTKGMIRISPEEAMRQLLDLKVVLTTLVSKVNLEINAYRGSFKLNEDFYSPILEILKNNEPVQVFKIKEAIESALKREVKLAEINEALIALSEKNCISLVQEESNIETAKIYTRNLNTHILKQSLQPQDTIAHLVSPITGDALSFSRFEIMFLYASTIHADQETQVDFIFDVLQRNGEKIIQEGKELSDKETRRTLKEKVQELEEWIPLFRKLQIL